MFVGNVLLNEVCSQSPYPKMGLSPNSFSASPSGQSCNYLCKRNDLSRRLQLTVKFHTSDDKWGAWIECASVEFFSLLNIGWKSLSIKDLQLARVSSWFINLIRHIE